MLTNEELNRIEELIAREMDSADAQMGRLMTLTQNIMALEHTLKDIDTIEDDLRKTYLLDVRETDTEGR